MFNKPHPAHIHGVRNRAALVERRNHSDKQAISAGGQGPDRDLVRNLPCSARCRREYRHDLDRTVPDASGNRRANRTSQVHAPADRAAERP